MEDQATSQEVIRLMWSIMPYEAIRFEFYGKVYESYTEGFLCLFDKRDKKYHFAFSKQPTKVIQNILDLMSKLRTLSPFKKEPWTHFKITLHDDGKFNFEFAYIPEEKNEVGTFMKEGNPAPYPPES